jgi:hypothetical protein
MIPEIKMYKGSQMTKLIGVNESIVHICTNKSKQRDVSPTDSNLHFVWSKLFSLFTSFTVLSTFTTFLYKYQKHIFKQ